MTIEHYTKLALENREKMVKLLNTKFRKHIIEKGEKWTQEETEFYNSCSKIIDLYEETVWGLMHNHPKARLCELKRCGGDKYSND